MEGNITNDICQGFPFQGANESGANATIITIKIGVVIPGT